MFTFAICCRLSVCLSVVCLSVCLSVTLVHPIHSAVEIFGSTFTAFGTSAIRWHPIHEKFYGDCPRGTPPSGELNTRGVAKHNDFGPISKAISRKRWKIGGKLVLITNRKSHISFRVVQKIGDLKWPWMQWGQGGQLTPQCYSWGVKAISLTPQKSVTSRNVHLVVGAWS